MPSALRHHQYELCDSAGNSQLVFGTEDTGYLTITRPGFETAELQTNDTPRPGEDGWIPGRDYLTSGGVHTFEMGVLTDAINGLGGFGALREQANVDYIDKIMGVWRDPRSRQTPQAYTILRKAMADGSLWRTYGRPRQIDPVEGNMTKEGYSDVLCNFAAFEEGWYSDTVEQASAALRMVDENGLISPLVAPITTVGEANAVIGFTVGGTRPTWPRIVFTGPVLNPSLTIGQGSLGNIVFGLDGQVNTGEQIEIDPSPWRRGVRRLSDGASRAGALSAATPSLQHAQMPPGAKTLTFRGIDATGTATAIIQWRKARNR